MGRLRGLLLGIVMIMFAIAVEFIGKRADNIYSGNTPEIVGIATFAMLLAVSYFLKSDRIAVLAVFTASAVYGLVAYLIKLDFFYHDYPERLSVFAPTIVSRSILYALPVFIGHLIVAIKAKRRVRSQESQQLEKKNRKK